MRNRYGIDIRIIGFTLLSSLLSVILFTALLSATIAPKDQSTGLFLFSLFWGFGVALFLIPYCLIPCLVAWAISYRAVFSLGFGRVKAAMAGGFASALAAGLTLGVLQYLKSGVFPLGKPLGLLVAAETAAGLFAAWAIYQDDDRLEVLKHKDRQT